MVELPKGNQKWDCYKPTPMGCMRVAPSIFEVLYCHANLKILQCTDWCQMRSALPKSEIGYIRCSSLFSHHSSSIAPPRNWWKKIFHLGSSVSCSRAGSVKTSSNENLQPSKNSSFAMCLFPSPSLLYLPFQRSGLVSSPIFEFSGCDMAKFGGKPGGKHWEIARMMEVIYKVILARECSIWVWLNLWCM